MVAGLFDYGVFGNRSPNMGVDDLLGVPLTVDAKRQADHQAAPAPAVSSPASTLAAPVSLAGPLAPASIPPAWLAAGGVGLVLLILAARR